MTMQGGSRREVEEDLRRHAQVLAAKERKAA
jgi:hypothetical protein